MSDCLEWTGCLNAYGYGVRTIAQRYWLVHRLAWVNARGSIPDGMCVLHRCDNRRCYNIDHLWLGTKGDNNRDCAAKGRHVGYRKLTPDQIAEAMTTDRPVVDLAQEFGVIPSTIYRARKRYARLIADTVPELADVFEFRELRTA